MITPEKAKKEMEALAAHWDTEYDHPKADALLVRIIRDNLPEYEDVLVLFETMKKWYA